MDRRIYEHPVVEFDRGKKINIYLNGKPVKTYENETIAAALYAMGLTEFSKSIKYRRPRGFFCAIGRCSCCMMEVDGVPNVRTCIMQVNHEMQIKHQNTWVDVFSPILNKLKLSPSLYLRLFTRPSFIYNPAMKMMRQLTGIGNIPKKTLTHQEELVSKEILETDFLIIGGGPAGMSAAIETGQLGVDTIIIDDKSRLGGQLVKQTHMFFGDAKYVAGRRGTELGKEMCQKIFNLDSVRVMVNTSAVGYYPSQNLMLIKDHDGKSKMIRAKKYLISTGAYEKTLVFENNDLPGIYGAGGVQTLLNVYGIKPGKKGIILGTGNVALIVAYHLLQAGVEIEGVYAPSFSRISGYLVHAAKIRRQGIPIITRHTIVKALGTKKVKGAILSEINSNYKPIAGTEKKVDCDFICIGVGLVPAYELVQLFNPKMVNTRSMGLVPIRDKQFRFTPNAYIAGDCSGIEEATTAMLEGRLSGLFAAKSLGFERGYIDDKIQEYRNALEMDRGSDFSIGIRAAIEEITVDNINEVLT